MPTNLTKRVIKITPLHLATASSSRNVKFPSIVTQFADTWTPQWRQEFVYGRMDPISLYGGTDRKLTLGFRVIAEDEEEAKKNMIQLQTLIQWQYPVYNSRVAGTGISTLRAPPYFLLDFLNITSAGSHSVQGYFNGPITINPGFQSKDKAQFFIPKDRIDKLAFSDVEVTLQMVVLHQRMAGFYGSGFGARGARMANYPYNIPKSSVHSHVITEPLTAAPSMPPGPSPGGPHVERLATKEGKAPRQPGISLSPPTSPKARANEQSVLGPQRGNV